MYYPSTQHDDYYEDGGWGLGACAGDADDPAGQHAGTQLGQKVTAADGSEHFITWDNEYEIAIAHPFNQRAYEAYQRKVQQSGKPEKVFKGAVQFSNGKWGWVDKNDTTYIYRRLIDENMPSYGDKEIFKRYEKYEQKRAKKNLPDTNWDQRAPARPLPSERRQQAPRAPRNFVIHDAGGGNPGNAAVQAGPPRGAAPAGRGRGRGGGAGPNFGNRGQPPAGPPPPPPPAAPRPPPNPAPPPAQKASDYAAAARQAPAPAAAAPAGARAAAGAPQGPPPTYNGVRTAQGAPMLHLPKGTQWTEAEREQFRNWTIDFIEHFKMTGETTKDIPKLLFGRFSDDDRNEIKKQKKAYKDYWNWMKPGHVYPQARTYGPAPAPPPPGQGVAKPPAQAQKPTHKAVQHAMDLYNMFEMMDKTGSFVEQTQIPTMLRKNFYNDFLDFAKLYNDQQGVFSGLTSKVISGFFVHYLLSRVVAVENHSEWISDILMPDDKKFACNLMMCLKIKDVKRFFDLFQTDDLAKSNCIKNCAFVFRSIGNEMQTMIDEAVKIKANDQKNRVIFEAAQRVLAADGGNTAPPADLRAAVDAVRQNLLGGVYDMDTNNDKDIKVQFAAGLMAHHVEATEPTATLFFLLQRMIPTIPLHHFRKLVTASDLFKDALALYKELSKPPAAEGGAAAGGRPARQGMLPDVAAAPVAPAPSVAQRAAGGGGGDDDWADGGEEDYKPTSKDIQNVMDMFARRPKPSAGGNQGFFSGAGDDGWTAAGGGGQPRGRARLPNHSEGGGSNLAPGGAGFFGGGNRYEALEDHRDPEALPQRPKFRQARGDLTDAPEATDVDLDIPEPAGGAAVAAIEETAAEERAASAAGSARSGRSASASAGGGAGRARSSSRSARESSVVNVDTAVDESENVYQWLLKWDEQHPEATEDYRMEAIRNFVAGLNTKLEPQKIKEISDKVRQTLNFKKLSQRYEDY